MLLGPRTPVGIVILSGVAGFLSSSRSCGTSGHAVEVLFSIARCQSDESLFGVPTSGDVDAAGQLITPSL